MKVILVKDDGTKIEFTKFILIGDNDKKQNLLVTQKFTVEAQIHAAAKLQQKALNEVDKMYKESGSNE